jgi:hypothetical protein
MQMFWTFKLSFDVDILALFCLETVLATFFKMGNFFKSSGHLASLYVWADVIFPRILDKDEDALIFNNIFRTISPKLK